MVVSLPILIALVVGASLYYVFISRRKNKGKLDGKIPSGQYVIKKSGIYIDFETISKFQHLFKYFSYQHS